MALDIKISEKDKQIAVIAGLVIFGVLLLVLVFAWQIPSIARSHARARDNKEKIVELKKDMANLAKYKQKIDEFNKQIEHYKTKVILEEDIPLLIESISNLANSLGVKIIKIRPIISERAEEQASVSKEGSYSKIQIEVVANADFHQFGAFVSQLENEGGFFRFASLDVSGSAGDPMMQDIRFTLNSVVALSRKTTRP